MRSFRSKPVGWRNDSYRHYLAQKGVKTKHKYFMPFIQEEVEFVGSGEEKNLGWRGKLVKYQYEREKAVEQEIADLKLRHEKEVMRGNVREAELLDARIAEREDERRVRAERFVNHAVWIGEKSPSEYEEVGREIEEEEEMK